MDATPIDFDLARPLAGRRQLMEIDPTTRRAAPPLAQTWQAIHDAAATVGAIAGINQASIATELKRGFGFELPEGSPSAFGPSLEDLAEVLQHGIIALLAAHVHGGSPQIAARSLWREFIGTRDRLMES